MRTIDVTLHCDWPGCDFSVLESEADGRIRERPLSIDNKASKIFAVCKPHDDQLNEILLPLLAKALKAEAVAKPGKKPGAGAAAAGELSANVSDKSVPCQVPECAGRQPLASRVGLAQHVTRTHNFENLAAYDAAYPTSG